MFDDLDRQTSLGSEAFARAISRRGFVQKGVKGAFATIAGLSIGSLINVKSAFAVTCTCHWACGRQCSSIGTGTYSQYCPSGCSTCVPSSGCYNCTVGGANLCPYSDGSWTSCTGLGTCQAGYRICRDCTCGSCNNACTVLSSVICGNCCSPQQVEAEMRRLRAEAELMAKPA